MEKEELRETLQTLADTILKENNTIAGLLYAITAAMHTDTEEDLWLFVYQYADWLREKLVSVKVGLD